VAREQGEEDEIVQEIPIVLSQELAHTLYLMQSPLRYVPALRRGTNALCSTALLCAAQCFCARLAARLSAAAHVMRVCCSVTCCSRCVSVRLVSPLLSSPPHRPYDSELGARVSLQVKPIQKKVEMEYRLEEAGVMYQASV
jgi:hypothetical protein